MKKLVFDVGGTMVKYALMDMDAKIYRRGKIQTNDTSFEEFMESLYSIYVKVKDQVDGIAFSLPGRIDSEKGFIYSPGALAFNYNCNFVEKAKHYFPVPITIENDGKCAALAELWLGKLCDIRDGIVIVLGTGIGGGIILNHELHKGTDFFAGELSYMMADFKKSDFKHSFAFQAGVRSLITKVSKQKGIPFEELNGEKVFEMILSQDEIACNCFDEMIDTLAGGIFTISALFNPQKVLIGGGISRQPIVLQEIQRKLQKIYDSLPFEIPRCNVDTCKFFNESNLIGALYNFKIQSKKKQEEIIL